MHCREWIVTGRKCSSEYMKRIVIKGSVYLYHMGLMGDVAVIYAQNMEVRGGTGLKGVRSEGLSKGLSVDAATCKGHTYLLNNLCKVENLCNWANISHILKLNISICNLNIYCFLR